MSVTLVEPHIRSCDGGCKREALISRLRIFSRVGPKIVLAGGVFATFLVICGIGRLLSGSPQVRRRFSLRLTSAFSKFALRILGIQVALKPSPPHATRTTINVPVGRLIFSNHLSYLDILAIASTEPALFVTSTELEQSFLLGDLAKAGGALFIERRNRSRLIRDIAAIEEALAQGFSVVVFPEGTTSNGEGLLPFKNSLTAAATRGAREILPLCLRYTHVNDQPISHGTRDKLHWYGEMKFFPHLLELLTLRSARIEVSRLQPLSVRLDSCRKELTRSCRDLIEQAYLGDRPSFRRK